MPYKREYHKIVCPRCGKEYEVLTQAYKRKLTDPVYGMYCSSCRAKIQMEEMDPDKKAELMRKANEATKQRYQRMSDEEKEDIKQRRAEGVKRYWANLSDAERQSISEKRSKDRRDQINGWTAEERARIGDKISNTKRSKFASMSEEEYQDYFEKASKAHQESWNHKTDEEKQKTLEVLRKNAEELRQSWYNMTDAERLQRITPMVEGSREYNNRPEVKEALRQRNKDQWDAMSEAEQKQRIVDLHKSFDDWLNDPENREILSNKAIERWERRSDEFKQKALEALSAGNKRYWDDMSPEDRQVWANRISVQSKQMWENRTEEELSQLKALESQKAKERWQNMPEEERAEISDKLRKMLSDIRQSMTPEKKSEVSKKLSEARRTKFASMTEEELTSWNRHLQEAHKQWFDNLTDEERDEFYRKIFMSAGKRNKFNEKFEKALDASHIADIFNVVLEYSATKNRISHYWDYGICDKETGGPLMVIDLDGAYYHGDISDYDGIHGNEERDEKRFLSIPDNVIPLIITEFKLDEGFQRMKKLLLLTYDEYVEYMFNECRSMPFPEPQYTNDELTKSWFRLIDIDCLNSQNMILSKKNHVGERMIFNFHKSLYSASYVGNASPQQAWNDDALLKEAIRNHTIFQSYLNMNKLLQGFNVSDVGTRIDMMTPVSSKLIIDKYLSKYDVIFDPFSGFSGRMLGALSLGKRYIGQDLSEVHVRESNEIIEFLRSKRFKSNAEITQIDALDSYGEYPCLFTSPPTMNEEFVDVPASTLTADEWIDVCMEHFKCETYVFVVDKTEKYTDRIVDVILDPGYKSSNEFVVLIG